MIKITLGILALLFSAPAMADSWQVTLHKVVDPESVPQFFGTAYFGTFYCSDKAYTLPTGVSTYVAYVESDGSWVFTDAYESNNVVKNEALVLYIDEQVARENGYIESLEAPDKLTFTLKEATSGQVTEGAYKVDGMNDLWGTDVATDLTAVTSATATANVPAYDADQYYYYALQFHHKHGNCQNSAGVKNERCPHIGFFWMNQTGEGFTNGANKAYLRVAKSHFTNHSYEGDPSDARMGFSFLDLMRESDATGLSELRDESLELREGKTIEDGRVVIIKNGVKYNAAGQQIK